MGLSVGSLMVDIEVSGLSRMEARGMALQVMTLHKAAVIVHECPPPHHHHHYHVA